MEEKEILLTDCTFVHKIQKNTKKITVSTLYFIPHQIVKVKNQKVTATFDAPRHASSVVDRRCQEILPDYF